MKYFVVADPHGHYDALCTALEKKGFFQEEAPHKLVVCGDLFDRGEQAKEMQRLILQPLEEDRVILVRGNHEDLALQLCQCLHTYFVSEAAVMRSVHFYNGTVQTLLDLTGMALQEAVADCDAFRRAVEATPYFTKIIPAARDWFETEHYVFVHGWIPCHTRGYILQPQFYFYRSDWRTAEPADWTLARWYNGMEAWRQGVREPGKTIVCGHRNASYGHAVLEGRGTEFGADADNTSFCAEGILALDTHTARSGLVNCAVLEDTPLLL